jgi:hypothetical protein
VHYARFPKHRVWAGTRQSKRCPLLLCHDSPQPISTPFVFRCLPISNCFTFHFEFPSFSPLKCNGSQARDQVFTRLCEHIFAFVLVKPCFNAIALSNWIFTATGLLTGGLVPRATVPNVWVWRALWEVLGGRSDFRGGGCHS